MLGGFVVQPLSAEFSSQKRSFVTDEWETLASGTAIGSHMSGTGNQTLLTVSLLVTCSSSHDVQRICTIAHVLAFFSANFLCLCWVPPG